MVTIGFMTTPIITVQRMAYILSKVKGRSKKVKGLTAGCGRLTHVGGWIIPWVAIFAADFFRGKEIAGCEAKVVDCEGGGVLGCV